MLPAHLPAQPQSHLLFEYGQQRVARTNPLSAQVGNISGRYQLAVQTASVGVAMAF